MIRGAPALRFLDPASDRSLDSRTFGEFLRAHGQNDATIESMWSIVATATLNLPPDEASLALATKVFRTGLLDQCPQPLISATRSRRWASCTPTAAGAALQAAGVEVTAPISVLTRSPRATGALTVIAGDRSWRADDVVLALPHKEAFAVAPQLERTEAKSAIELGNSPIVNIHVVYDRKVTDLDFAAAVGSPVQWIFDRTESSGLRALHPGAQYLAITVSSADAIIDVPSRTLQEQFTEALAALFPGGRDEQRCSIHSSRANGEPRSGRPRGHGHCVPPPPPVQRGSGWPEPGPTRGGRTRWKVRCAAESLQPKRSFAPQRSRRSPSTSRRPGRCGVQRELRARDPHPNQGPRRACDEGGRRRSRR